jgi:hypothetical protein
LLLCHESNPWQRSPSKEKTEHPLFSTSYIRGGHGLGLNVLIKNKKINKKSQSRVVIAFILFFFYLTNLIYMILENLIDMVLLEIQLTQR